MVSFRNRLEPDYKAGRTEPPPDLEPQFQLCLEVSRALGLQAFERPEFESDDLIATLATRLRGEGARVVVVSSDKDLAQLVSQDGAIVLHDFARGNTLDGEGVRARFGVDPHQIPDYLGLVGDAVDNLPGIRGVGPRSASALLRAFGSIEAIPSDPARWGGVGGRGAVRLARAVAEGRDRALRTRDLATLRRDVPGLVLGTSDLEYRGADRAQVESLFARLGWGEIATRVPRWS
jgi:5'-3' exonuclease